VKKLGKRNKSEQGQRVNPTRGRGQSLGEGKTSITKKKRGRQRAGQGAQKCQRAERFQKATPRILCPCLLGGTSFTGGGGAERV